MVVQKNGLARATIRLNHVLAQKRAGCGTAVGLSRFRLIQIMILKCATTGRSIPRTPPELVKI